jgi:hypothetical protein
MKQAVLRWTMYVGALFVAGPVAGWMVALVRAPEGGPDASPLTGSEPVKGLMLGIAAVGIAGVMGLLAAWLTNARAAMTTAGLTLAWAAWRAGNVEMILREAHSVAPLWRLAVEGTVFGLMAVAIMIGIHAVTRRDHHESAPRDAAGLGRTVRETAGGAGVLFAVVGAVAAGGAVTWIIANTGMKGQTVGAALVAGLVGAAVGRLVDNRAPASAFLIPAAVLAVIGPGAAAMALSGDIVGAVNRGGLFPVARVMPLDWIAGAFLGVPIGLGWTGSVVDKRA